MSPGHTTQIQNCHHPSVHPTGGSPRGFEKSRPGYRDVATMLETSRRATSHACEFENLGFSSVALP